MRRPQEIPLLIWVNGLYLPFFVFSFWLVHFFFYSGVLPPFFSPGKNIRYHTLLLTFCQFFFVFPAKGIFCFKLVRSISNECLMRMHAKKDFWGNLIKRLQFFSFPDYKEELKRNLTRKGLYIPTATSDGDVQENGGVNQSPNTYLRNHVNSTLPRPHHNGGAGSAALNNGGNIMNGVNGSYNNAAAAAANNTLHLYTNQFSQANHHPPQHNPYQTLQHYHHHRSPPPNPPPPVHPRAHPPPQQQQQQPPSGVGGVDFANEFIGPLHHHPHQQQLPHHHPNSNDFNTVYIRDKLLLDSDIPESCVWACKKTFPLQTTN